ncbi:hypothetical protein SCHPADRAFT_704778 [Schizopora paradoxa]|uniref:Uncharacterized protein n=1 Tax=Schizopora paradoxa TaxID=27342 RepID=A0A0H2R952_9AGAM|nr:hypothetical protein SCHPADRAFT_704778 [Schizopora paradoxa]
MDVERLGRVASNASCFFQRHPSRPSPTSTSEGPHPISFQVQAVNRSTRVTLICDSPSWAAKRVKRRCVTEEAPIQSSTVITGFESIFRLLSLPKDVLNKVALWNSESLARTTSRLLQMDREVHAQACQKSISRVSPGGFVRYYGGKQYAGQFYWELKAPAVSLGGASAIQMVRNNLRI